MGALSVISPALNDVGAATANTTRIKALLASGGSCGLVGAGVVYVNDTLTLGDFTKLHIPSGMTLRQAPGTNKKMFQLASSLLVAKEVTSLTSSGNVATAVCAAHGYSVGDYVTIEWAATLGYAGVFRVASVTDANTFTYRCREPFAATPAVKSTMAGTSSYSAGDFIQTRKATVGANLTIEGVLDYDRANNGGAVNNNLHAAIFAHGADCKIDIPGKVVNASKYAVLVASVYGVSIPQIAFDTDSDGLHITGPATAVRVGLLQGNCGDNMVGAGTGDYLAYHLSEGPIENCSVDAIVADDMDVDTVRFFGCDLYPIDFRLGDIISAQTVGMIVNLGADAVVRPNGNTWIRDLEIGSVKGNRGNGRAIGISSPRVDRIKAKLHAFNNSTRVQIGGSAVVKLADIEEINMISGTMSSAGIGVDTGATVRKLIARPNYENTVNSAGPVRKNGGTIEQVDIIGARVKGGAYVYSDVAGAVGDTRLSIIGGEIESVTQVIDHAQTTGDLYASFHGGYIKPNTRLAQNTSSGASKVVIRGDGADFGTLAAPHVIRSGTQALEVYNEDVKVDISTLARTPGQRCWNTNAALGTLAAAGIVDCDAAGVWHLRTDPTKTY